MKDRKVMHRELIYLQTVRIADFFDFHDQNRWPYNPTYDGWWTHDTLPKLNYEGSGELYDYVLNSGTEVGVCTI